MSELKRRGTVWHIATTVRVGNQSRTVRETTGCRSIQDARIVLARRIEEVRQELLRGPAERSWAEAAAEYLADLERRGKSSRRALIDVEALLPAIGALPLSHVHQRTLQPWIDAKRGEWASGTVERALHTATTILHFASRVLRDGDTPWLTLAVPKLSAPDWGRRQPYAISWEEQDRLYAELPASLRAPFLFSVATGARQGEVVALEWSDHVPVEGLPQWSVWWVRPEIRKASARLSASAQSGRYLVANLLARNALQGLSEAPGAIFGGAERFNNRSWRAAVSRAGLDIRWHDLRHTFGERAATAGVPLDIRRSLLGHAHASITEHYSRAGLARLLEEAERVNRGVAILRPVAQNQHRAA